MKKGLLLLTTISVLIAISYYFNIRKNEQSLPKTTDCTSVNTLSKLYNEIKQPDKNLIFSPIGLFSTLGIVYAGAKEQTAKEIINFLNVEENNKVHECFKNKNNELNSWFNKHIDVSKLPRKAFDIDNPNKIKDFPEAPSDVFSPYEKVRFEIENTVEFSLDSNEKKAYTGLLEKYYGVKIVRKPSEYHGLKIRNIVNFTARWKAPRFENTDNDCCNFYISKTNKKAVAFMYSLGNIPIYKENGFRAGLIPTERNKAYMAVIIPDDIEGLPIIEKKLNNVMLSKIMKKVGGKSLNNTQVQYVKLFIPKFSLNSNINMTNILKKVGIKEAFSSQKANFKNITDTSLFIDKFSHNASIDVNEYGFSASAKSEISMRGYPSKKNEVFVNRPFMFFIFDGKTKTILFMGRVIDPTKP